MRLSGARVDLEGLDLMRKDIKFIEKNVHEIAMDSLRGNAGEEIQRQVKRRLSAHTQSGYTASRVEIQDEQQLVQIGLFDKGKHPMHSRANPFSIGVWLESGTRAHPIVAKHGSALRIDNGFAAQASHPGTRAKGIMRKTLKATKNDVIDEIVKSLERRTGRGSK